MEKMKSRRMRQIDRHLRRQHRRLLAKESERITAAVAATGEEKKTP